MNVHRHGLMDLSTQLIVCVNLSIKINCLIEISAGAFSAKFKIWRQFINLKLAPLALWMSGNLEHVTLRRPTHEGERK
jgi:hypothetical protein